MKKCSVITGMILASLLLFMNSCEKDYLNAEEISYSLTVSDTVYLNEPVTIKGVINQDLDIRVYWENWNNDHLIGVLKPYRAPSGARAHDHLFQSASCAHEPRHPVHDLRTGGARHGP